MAPSDFISLLGLVPLLRVAVAAPEQAAQNHAEYRNEERLSTAKSTFLRESAIAYSDITYRNRLTYKVSYGKFSGYFPVN